MWYSIRFSQFPIGCSIYLPSVLIRFKLQLILFLLLFDRLVFLIVIFFILLGVVNASGVVIVIIAAFTAAAMVEMTTGGSCGRCRACRNQSRFGC